MLASCYLAHRHNSLRFVFLISKNETVKIIMGGGLDDKLFTYLFLDSRTPKR